MRPQLGQSVPHLALGVLWGLPGGSVNVASPKASQDRPTQGSRLCVFCANVFSKGLLDTWVCKTQCV